MRNSNHKPTTEALRFFLFYYCSRTRSLLFPVYFNHVIMYSEKCKCTTVQNLKLKMKMLKNYCLLLCYFPDRIVCCFIVCCFKVVLRWI